MINLYIRNILIYFYVRIYSVVAYNFLFINFFFHLPLGKNSSFIDFLFTGFLLLVFAVGRGRIPFMPLAYCA